MDFAAARRNMVASQIKTNRVADPLVIEAMGNVPRERFLPLEQRQFAYVDEDLSIGQGRVIMEPMVLARMLQLADIQTSDTAMVIGAGAGYSTAVLARMASSVVAVDSDPPLAAREGPIGCATLVTRNGSAYSQRQEFDAATQVLPGFEKQSVFVF